VVVVYYWASWCQSVAADFAKLKKLAADYYGKGLEVVCVNVDDNQPDAEAVVKRAQPPGCQLFSAGGLDSPLATQYGLIVFPNVFLVGRDGKVLSRTVEVNGLEEELKKVMK
jgi:thiol-disulfide isomerase/thioredoxin